MKTKIVFMNIGNADTSLIQLKNGKNIIWDYANMQGELHCDLPKEINLRVPQSYLDVVCFTHADEDHVKGIKDFFFLEHAEKYQGAKRKKISDLWVPASLFLEKRTDLCDDAKVLLAEAKYRLLILKSGIKVFSKPEAFKDYVKEQGVDFSEVKHLVVDAGTLVPGWTKDEEGIEFFVHSPFKGHVDESTIVDRNLCSIIAQATFGNAAGTRLLLTGDACAMNWIDIVKISKYHKNTERLKWDIQHLSHHCSYKALNEEDKGKNKSEPIPEVKWLMEEQSSIGCMLISPSDIIPNDTTDQPPHRQAYNYYSEDVAQKKQGSIKVTMEYPTKKAPAPIVVEIDDDGFRIAPTLSEKDKSDGVHKLASSSPVSGNYCKL